MTSLIITLHEDYDLAYIELTMARYSDSRVLMFSVVVSALTTTLASTYMFAPLSAAHSHVKMTQNTLNDSTTFIEINIDYFKSLNM